MADKKKYYVVWKGANTGVFHHWVDCEKAIKGYTGALYRSFPTLEEAVEAFKNQPTPFAKKNVTTSLPSKKIPKSNIILESLSVDAACSGNPGKMEYRGVDTRTGEEIFKQGPFELGTNNIGEFLAIVHALALLNKHGHALMPIYTDSKTALAWVRKKHPNTKLAEHPKNEILFQLMQRAVDWLKSNNYKNPIIKWETESWGEIPADFGRK